MPLLDDSLIRELGRLEAAGDLAAGLELLRARPMTPEELLKAAAQLYHAGLSAFPFVMAEQLLRAGYENSLVHALSAHLGSSLDRLDIADRSIAYLSTRLAASAAERQSVRHLLDPWLPREVVTAFHDGQTRQIERLARLWRTVEPEIMRSLAPPPPERKPDLDRFRRAGDETRLLTLATPAGALRRERVAVLGMRRYWFPDRPSSREHEIPPLIAAAMAAYGWRPLRHHLRSLRDAKIVAEDYQAIAALCRAKAADLLVLDNFQPSWGAPAEILRGLKQERPALRIVAFYLDPWSGNYHDDMKRAAAYVDAFWSPIAVPLWQQPPFQGRTLLSPTPHGDGSFDAEPLRPELGFSGGVEYANWYRAFWLTAIEEAALPLRVILSTHQHEGPGVLDGYRRFMQRLAKAGTALNFARRADGATTLTGRTIEVPAAGGLLVQERSDDIDRFLVANRHYLRFETLDDLADIVHLLRREPDLAESIRKAGADFVRERYSDEKIIAALDHFLFHRPPLAAAG